MLSEDQLKSLRRALHEGKYNLLVGAGISRDSTNASGGSILASEALRKQLCDLKGLDDKSSLSRAATYLTPKEVTEYLTNQFHNCHAGDTTKLITEFVWSQIYTLNIDDALENAYRISTLTRRQSALSVNYTRPFETFRHRVSVPIIHLHGFVGEPDTPYVFSTKDYGRAIGELCSWTIVLSQLIETEPFIISGTSLTEPDLEYYLSKREGTAGLRKRGLSFLVEPFPDAGTKLDCKRFGLVLVESTLFDFLSYLVDELGPSPAVSSVIVPTTDLSFKKTPDSYTQVAFFSDFELVVEEIAKSKFETENLKSFYFGRPPTWHDITERTDVVLKEQLLLKDPAYTWLSKPSQSRVLIGIGRPGSGKSTTLKRVAVELTESYQNVFYLKSQDGLDVDADVEFLSSLDQPSILCVDNIAERADNIQSMLDKLGDSNSVLVIGAERNYRKRHLELVFDVDRTDMVPLGAWTKDERIRLTESFQTAGFTGSEEALKSPHVFLRKIENVPVAEAVCMILNDYRPLRNIVTSLWNDANDHQRIVYLTVALAHFCQPQGVRYSIASAATKFNSQSLMTEGESPLPLTEHSEDPEFLLPLNAVVGARLVEIMSKEKPDRLLEAFERLGVALAPYVTRITIKQQSAEARLAGRLFAVEDIVRPLLGERWDELFEAVRPNWKWNSRFWEQRAIGMSSVDLPLALQYARHALAIEDHPFSKTTLAKLLLLQVVQQPGLAGAKEFDEALQLCKNVFVLQNRDGWRPSKVPYFILFGGVRAYLDAGGTVSLKQRELIEKACTEGVAHFPRDEGIKELSGIIRKQLASIETTGPDVRS